MRNYSKTGSKPGKPGYRTPSSFINVHVKKISSSKTKKTRTKKQNKSAFSSKVNY